VSESEPKSWALEVLVHDRRVARNVARELNRLGAASVEFGQGRGVDPHLPLTIFATVSSVAVIGSLALSWVQRRGCQVILDVRGGKVRKEVDCRVRDGRLIIIAVDGISVQITDAPQLVDLTSIINAAITAGSDAVKALATASGARVD